MWKAAPILALEDARQAQTKATGSWARGAAEWVVCPVRFAPADRDRRSHCARVEMVPRPTKLGGAQRARQLGEARFAFVCLTRFEKMSRRNPRKFAFRPASHALGGFEVQSERREGKNMLSCGSAAVLPASTDCTRQPQA